MQAWGVICLCVGRGRAAGLLPGAPTVHTETLPCPSPSGATPRPRPPTFSTGPNEVHSWSTSPSSSSAAPRLPASSCGSNMPLSTTVTCGGAEAGGSGGPVNPAGRGVKDQGCGRTGGQLLGYDQERALTAPGPPHHAAHPPKGARTFSGGSLSSKPPHPSLRSSRSCSERPPPLPPRPRLPPPPPPRPPRFPPPPAADGLAPPPPLPLLPPPSLPCCPSFCSNLALDPRAGGGGRNGTWGQLATQRPYRLPPPTRPKPSTLARPRAPRRLADYAFVAGYCTVQDARRRARKPPLPRTRTPPSACRRRAAARRPAAQSRAARWGP